MKEKVQNYSHVTRTGTMAEASISCEAMLGQDYSYLGGCGIGGGVGGGGGWGGETV